jgi:hypothetical protein
MTDQTLIPAAARSPETQETLEAATGLAAIYENFTITEAGDYAAGGHDLKSVKAMQKALVDRRMKITRPMDAAKAEVMDLFRPAIGRLEEAETHIKTAMIAFKDEQDRIAAEAARVEREKAEKRERELRRKADEEARKAAEKRRLELQKQQEVERKRQEKERARLEEERAKARDEEEKKRIEQLEEQQRERQAAEEKRLHELKLDAERKAEEDSARAASLEAQADAATSGPVTSGAPKVSGISTSKVWDFEIIDAELIPAAYKDINEVKIRKVVKALKKDAEDTIPGIRVFQKTSMAAGSR